MTQTAAVALGIVLIAIVIYLATEHTGLRGEIVTYVNGVSPHQAEELDIAAGSRMTVTRTQSVVSGQDRATYTLTPDEQLQTFYADGALRGSSHEVDIESADASRLTISAVQSTTGTRRVTYTLTPLDVPIAIPMYADGGTSVGTGETLAIQSADTTLLTVTGAEAADPVTPTLDRVTYTLTPTDQSPVYRLNGGGEIPASAGHALDFRPGTCLSGALTGDGVGGAMIALSYTCGSVGGIFRSEGTANREFQIRTLPNGMVEDESTQDFGLTTGSTTTGAIRREGGNLRTYEAGDYLIIASVELGLRDPGTIRTPPADRMGTCPSTPPGLTFVAASTGVATGATDLASLDVNVVPYYTGTKTALPAGMPYCESGMTDAGTSATIPDEPTDQRALTVTTRGGDAVAFYDSAFIGRLEVTNTGLDETIVIPAQLRPRAGILDNLKFGASSLFGVGAGVEIVPRLTVDVEQNPLVHTATTIAIEVIRLR